MNSMLFVVLVGSLRGKEKALDENDSEPCTSSGDNHYCTMVQEDVAVIDRRKKRRLPVSTMVCPPSIFGSWSVSDYGQTVLNLNPRVNNFKKLRTPKKPTRRRLHYYFIVVIKDGCIPRIQNGFGSPHCIYCSFSR